jgi:DNA-binding transcriptional LysR family regulator
MGGTCYVLCQMPDPVENAELLAFTRSVETKSLSRAAAELGVPRATIGRRLARLEERLGARLLRRTTRTMALTDAGAAFYEHARAVLDAVARAEASVRQSGAAVRGIVRVATPPMLDSTFNRFICDFARAYPQVQLHIDASARAVDLVREGYDVALRAGSEFEPGLVARTVARTSAVAVASPDYLQTHGVPKKARDLRAHKCLVGLTPAGQPRPHWPRAGGGKLSIEPALVANDITLLLDAALAGLGIALLPTLLVGAPLKTGELVRVLPKLVHAETRVAIVYQEKELMAPAVRVFIDGLIAWVPHALAGERRAPSRWHEPRSAIKRSRA